MRILVSTSSFGVADPSPLRRLEAEGLDVSLNPYGRVLAEDEVVELIRDADGIIAGTEQLSEHVLGQAPRLRVISRVGTGLESVDLAAAERRGIRVFNTPDALTDAVAELTVGGMLALLRRLPELNASLHAGRWEKQMGSLLRGKTVGVVGLGRIGKAVARLVTPFRARVIASDVEPDHEWASDHGVELVRLDELLRNADIVTIHASGAACLIGPAEFALMKEGAVLVNVARGWLVDEPALAAALDAGRLSACYLDTFGREPYDGVLCGMPNVLLTPHIGSYAREARVQMESEAVENLLAALAEARS
jgi:D-3-phosphoglycerate dehydrogenase